MNRFIVFIKRWKNNEKLAFAGRTLVFYLIFVALWIYFLTSKDSSAPVFIYEQF